MDGTFDPAGPQPLAPWPLEAPRGPLLLQQSATLLRLDGPDSLRFLHGQTSQDLQSAQPGEWRRSCCLSATARVTALVEVLADEAGAWLVITSGAGALVRQQLDRVLFPADQVSLGAAESVRLIECRPAADDGEAEDQERWSPLDGDTDGGFRLGRWHRVLRGATPLPADLATLATLPAEAMEALRIHLGRPGDPGELNGETNPFELGLAARVSLTKGCFVGQETLARLVTYDGIRQQLRRWHWQGPADLAARWLERLQPGQGLSTASDERAGRITSLLRLEAPEATGADGSEAEVRLIGLALVRRSALEEPWLLPTDDGSSGSGPEARPRLVLSRPEEFSLPGG